MSGNAKFRFLLAPIVVAIKVEVTNATVEKGFNAIEKLLWE